MKALTLTQPWATLVALGHKKIETRSWGTRYRGPIAIHAAKGFPAKAREFASREASLGRCPQRIPLASVIAKAKLVEVYRTEDIVLAISGLERHLGDFSFGRFAWMLEDVEAFAEPIGARGALGLWEWTDPR